MKVETTVELPEELLAAMDERSDEYGGRSELVEAALRALIEGPSQTDLEARDLALTAPDHARSYLERIAIDESRHAALAFRTAQWILRQHPSLAVEARPLAAALCADVDADLRRELFEPAFDALFAGCPEPHPVAPPL